MMEYSKCPLKKRPIFMIEEEEEIIDEDVPIDLTIKKPNTNFERPRADYQRTEMPLNFSNRLATITEEDYNTHIYYETNPHSPQDLSSNEFRGYGKLKKFISIESIDNGNHYDSNTINLCRNFNNNFIETTNYSTTLRTSPISPCIQEYNETEYIKTVEDTNQPQDLTIKLPTTIKPTILAVRNPNVIIETNKTTLLNTTYNNQNDSYYRCNTCTKCYSTYSGLIKHQQIHITNNEHSYINVIENTEQINNFIAATNNYQSDIQSNGNNDSGNIQHRHANIHRYQCKDCGKSYSTCSGLTKHQQFHCPNSDSNQVKKVFSCKNCDKVYVSLGALKMHIRTHTLPCKCPQCGKAFSRPWLLQGHIRTHTGEKPFSCQHCNRAFADRSNLRAHLQTHSDVKKYSCNSCTKTFSRMSLLGKHLQSGCAGTMKPNSSSESTDENSSHSYQNNNDYSESIENSNNNNNHNNNNSNNNNNNNYIEDVNNGMSTANMHYINSVIKGPTNYENYKQAFESY